MALFSRREIQSRIDEIARILTREQLHALVVRLNSTGQAAIDGMWELMWISALARHGTLIHEPKFSGTTRPDVHFKNSAVEFVADIAAVSDVGYEEANPIHLLYAELQKLYGKYRVFGGFSVHVGDKMEGRRRDQKVKLLLPSAAEMPQFVRKNFEDVIRQVANQPDRPMVFDAPVPAGGAIRLSYNPKRRPYSHGSGHLAFDVPYSLKRNPVFNVLKRKKQQLSDSGCEGLKGVIIGDGDCTILSSRMYSPTSYSLDQIVWEFLRQNTSIAFVLAVGIETHYQSLAIVRTTYSFAPKFYAQQRLADSTRTAVVAAINCALAEFPLPQRSPANARHHLAVGSPPPAKRSDFYGWHSYTSGDFMHPKEIKISARTLTALLGGEISLAEFREEHRHPRDNGGPPLEPLRGALEEGRKLEHISLEPLPGQDDDLVVLKFGRMDPAKVRFQLPDKQ